MTSLVIFDCDGVLVDSEMLSASVLKSMLAEEGMPITDEIFRQDFLGRSFATAAGRAHQRFGRPLPGDFQLRYRECLLQRMESDLKPMYGVHEVLENMTVPFCLATGSSPPRLAASLRITGLSKYFEGRAFTAAEVQNGKPAPDLFHYAAAKLGFAARDAIIVEDSEMGVQAAKSSGAKVWHFRGGAHVKHGFDIPTDMHVDAKMEDMGEVYSACVALGLCRAPTVG